MSEAGVETVSKALHGRVTKYHATIGSDVPQRQLKILEHKLLEEAKHLCYAQRWDEALNVFTHALAVSEKAHTDNSEALTTRAATVHNIGYCLHCLGEFEAAKAYYEEAIEAFKSIQTPAIDRWTVGILWGDVNKSRVSFIKECLLDVSFRKLPEREFLDEYGRKRQMPEAPSAPPVPPMHPSSGGRVGGHTHSSNPVEPWRRPAWLSAAQAAVDAGTAGPYEWVAATETGGEPARDAVGEEAARKEWLQYHLDTGEWEQAEELVVTAQERRELEFRRQRAERL